MEAKKKTREKEGRDLLILKKPDKALITDIKWATILKVRELFHISFVCFEDL